MSDPSLLNPETYGCRLKRIHPPPRQNALHAGSHRVVVVTKELDGEVSYGAWFLDHYFEFCCVPPCKACEHCMFIASSAAHFLAMLWVYVIGQGEILNEREQEVSVYVCVCVCARVCACVCPGGS
jgi:hypothetical protein